MTTIARLMACSLLLAGTSLSLAQDGADDDSNVTYPAAFFAQYQPLTVNDMLDRVPGIDLILNAGGGPNIDGDRGLGASSSILIDGKRLAGKANEAREQLNRIAADQVSHIEIVRGTSSTLDVQNTGQLVNIVLLEAQSQSNLATEVSAVHFDDGTIEPGFSASWSGQTGDLTYLLSGNLESAYQRTFSFEEAVNGDYSPHETRAIDRRRDQTNYSLNTNLAYSLGGTDRIAFNALYNESDPPTTLLRTFNDLDGPDFGLSYERESLPATASNWEFGGDYQKGLNNGDRFKVLFIVNEKKSHTTRERFAFADFGEPESKNLFLDTRSRYRERIVRSSWTTSVAPGQGLEVGAEAAQTIQDSNLKLGVLTPAPGDPAFGGLTPVAFPNANSTVEEVRFEPFAIHNWQINSRMSLESSLVAEYSEISQSGDVSNKRDFSFIKPKFDFRFDISSTLQFKATLEKVVGQLSFADFSRSSRDDDDDLDTIAGNPTLEPEESNRLEMSLDWRLPNDGGAINSRYFFYDFDNKIGRIDISTPGNLAATNGNVGPAYANGLSVNASLRLGLINLPSVLLTGNITVQDSKFESNPFAFQAMRFFPYDRGGYRLGFRQDIPTRNLSWGLNFFERIDGNRVNFDINNRFDIPVPAQLSAFAELQRFYGLTLRLEARNMKDSGRCLSRFRYVGDRRFTPISEVENICSTTGPEVSFSIRGNF